MRTWPTFIVITALVVAGCTSADDIVTTDADRVVAEEATIERRGERAGLKVLVDDLPGPTQMTRHPDGRILVAVLGEGGEGASTGQVIVLDPDSPGDRRVLVDGLDTPTGLAVAADQLWIMEPTQLLRAPLRGGDSVLVLDDMPNNGRSNGTITTLADGRLVFDTSGRRQGFDPAPDSGILWALDPGSIDGGRLSGPTTVGEVATPLLTGMKHAYAAVQIDDGHLAVTEMSDGRFDGEPAPDELMLIRLDEDDPPTGGWPRCIGDRQPVAEFDGTAEVCDQAAGSLALFEPGATPTSVAVTADGSLLVALWNSDQIVAVDRSDGAEPATVRLVTDQIANPQHLLVDGRRILVTGHADGTIVALQCCG